MSGRTALVSGVTGFIGKNLAAKLCTHGYRVTALVRPSANRSSLGALHGAVSFLDADLSDIHGLERQLSRHRWDVVFHLGAIRGVRSITKQSYFTVNVEATEVLGRYARQAGAKLIFCSSVGVYGTTPRILPPPRDSNFWADNIYHSTKIEAEKRLQFLVRRGLACVILRPGITYGTDDYGFPYLLIKLIDNGILILPTQPIQIHLVDVDTLCDAFLASAIRSIESGTVYNVLDANPVMLNDLVDFINFELKGRSYPRWKHIPKAFFRLAEITASLLHNPSWKARFELLSRSWYYDTDAIDTSLGVTQLATIPNFGKVVNWYKAVRG